MSGHVFVSYAKSDLEIAERVCDGLELRGTKCWIAPRDVTPGKTYATEIVRAIQDASSMVLIFSSRANASQHVVNEVDLAFSRSLRMFPFRLEDVELSEELKYYLSRPHWVDAFGKDLGPSLERLFEHVMAAKADWIRSRTSNETPSSSGPVAREQTSEGSERERRTEASPNKPAVETGPQQTKRPRRWVRWVLGGVVVAGLFVAYLNLIYVPGKPRAESAAAAAAAHPAAATARPAEVNEPPTAEHKKALKKKGVQEPTQ